MSTTLDEILEPIKAKTKQQLEMLESHLETDSDDFTGMHTTTGIDDDSFYSGFYDIDRAVDKSKQAIEAYIVERVETAEAKSFKNGFDEGVALHDQDVKCERERISHELKEIAWDDSKVRPGLKQVNLEFALEIVNKPLKSNERVSNE